MFHRSTIALCVLVAAFSAGGIASGTPSFAITDLGTLGGPNSSAFAINDSGEIAGYADIPVYSHTSTHAVRYSNGTMTDLGTMTVETPDLSYPTYGKAINASGQVVGYGYYAFLSPMSHAFVSSGGTMTDIGAAVGNSDNYAYGISDNGKVVGNYTSVSGSQRAFVYSGGTTLTDLDVLPGGTRNLAYAINSAGTKVVGHAYTASNKPHGVIWNGTAIEHELVPAYADGVSGAFGINSSGQVVGITSIDTTTTAPYLYSGGTMTVLPGLGGTAGRALAINDAGQLVGYASISGNATNRAFFYSSGTMTNLNDPGVVFNLGGWTQLDQAWDINNHGWIVGWGTKTDGQVRGFLLKPILPGDATMDGVVDIADLSKVLTNYDKSSMSWGDGDFDQSGAVDISDLSKVLTNYDKSSGASAVGVRAVPEPSTLLLAAFALTGLLVRRLRPDAPACGT